MTKRQDLVKELHSAERKLKRQISELSNAASSRRGRKAVKKNLDDVEVELTKWCNLLRELA